MSRTALVAVLLTIVFATGCTDTPAPPQSATAAREASTIADVTARLTRHVWRITSPTDRAPGSVYIFLPNSTLMMTSCVEVYRIAEWHLNPSGTLTIAEDPTATYDADILELSDATLRLRLHLKTEQVTLQFEPSPVPYVCEETRPV